MSTIVSKRGILRGRLHCWDTVREAIGGGHSHDHDGAGVELEDICHCRIPSDRVLTQLGGPAMSLLGATPYERRGLAIALKLGQ